MAEFHSLQGKLEPVTLIPIIICEQVGQLGR